MSTVTVQLAHVLYLALFQYSVDHNGKYPDGKSSTEIFQKLIDGGYLTDATYFYIPLPGKTKPVPGQPLKPENVCWDFTSALDSSSPDELPLVFMTGYRVTYAPGAIALPLDKLSNRTWSQWWNGEPSRETFDPGIAVTYKDGISTFLPLDTNSGTIPNFIAPTFKPGGKTYLQLTPNGPLPPGP
jgi:hypothetical protein